MLTHHRISFSRGGCDFIEQWRTDDHIANRSCRCRECLCIRRVQSIERFVDRRFEMGAAQVAMRGFGFDKIILLAGHCSYFEVSSLCICPGPNRGKTMAKRTAREYRFTTPQTYGTGDPKPH